MLQQRVKGPRSAAASIHSTPPTPPHNSSCNSPGYARRTAAVHLTPRKTDQAGGTAGHGEHDTGCHLAHSPSQLLQVADDFVLSRLRHETACTPGAARCPVGVASAGHALVVACQARIGLAGSRATPARPAAGHACSTRQRRPAPHVQAAAPPISVIKAPRHDPRHDPRHSVRMPPHSCAHLCAAHTCCPPGTAGTLVGRRGSGWRRPS